LAGLNFAKNARIFLARTPRQIVFNAICPIQYISFTNKKASTAQSCSGFFHASFMLITAYSAKPPQPAKA
jgi:hypothetical protein